MTRPPAGPAGAIGITPIVGMAQMLAARGADDSGARWNIAVHIDALHPSALLLMCGLRRMLDAVREAWAQTPRPAAKLRCETFGNSGGQANEAFWIQLPRHGVELQVPADRTLLDVLNDAGIETLFDCNRGECGLCACGSRVSGDGLVLDSAWRPE